MKPLFAVALCGLGLGLAACGPAEEDPGTPETFIALGRDFQGYESWTSFALAATTTNDVHTGQARTVYLNKAAPKGSSSWPPGTVIVKHGDDGTTFAMAKRGGGFNAAGAAGWEWFELQKTDTGAQAIVWRGVGPPVGEKYNQGDATCNDCHRAAEAHDFVQSAELKLE